MGTRGLLIFKYKQKRYSLYVHSDAYPEYIGELIILLIKSNNYSLWGEKLEFLFRDILSPIKSKYEKQYVEKKQKLIEEMKEENGENERRVVFTLDGKTKVIENYHKITIADFMLNPDTLTSVILKEFAPWIVDENLTIHDTKHENGKEWLYEIDLDSNELIINNRTKFGLSEIPYNWISYL